MNTITCPRCGTRNPADAMNCAACRINLRFALEHAVDIERVKQEDTGRDLLKEWLSVDLTSVVMVVIAVLVVMNAGLLLAAMARFKRSRLQLD